jgi:hypothetical protein
MNIKVKNVKFLGPKVLKDSYNMKGISINNYDFSKDHNFS